MTIDFISTNDKKKIVLFDFEEDEPGEILITY